MRSLNLVFLLHPLVLGYVSAHHLLLADLHGSPLLCIDISSLLKGRLFSVMLKQHVL